MAEQIAQVLDTRILRELTIAHRDPRGTRLTLERGQEPAAKKMQRT